MHDLNKTTRIELSNRPGEFVLLCEAGAAFIAANDIRSIYISMDGARRYGYVDYYKPDSLGETAPLARALAGASKGQIVRYHDGDAKNLRLSNLRLVPRARARRQSTDGGAA